MGLVGTAANGALLLELQKEALLEAGDKLALGLLADELQNERLAGVDNMLETKAEFMEEVRAEPRAEES